MERLLVLLLLLLVAWRPVLLPWRRLRSAGVHRRDIRMEKVEVAGVYQEHWRSPALPAEARGVGVRKLCAQYVVLGEKQPRGAQVAFEHRDLA